MTGVNIKVRADARQATAEMSKLSRSINSIDQQAKSVTSTFQKLAIGITAAFAAGGVTKGIIKASDAMTNMGNRVNLVTRDMKQTSIVMKELFSIAARSRSDVGAAADTFSRFGLALKDQNKPLKELLVVTEAVQKAGVISGSSTESAKAAIVQLGQGLASGQLRGQELNSVLEQMPRLAQAIAEGMDIPFGKLRESAMAGLVTAEAVYDAIIKGAQDIDDEYLLLKATVGGLSTVFKNEFTRAISEMDKVLGTTESIKTKILLATRAVRAFGASISTWALTVETQFIILRGKIKFFVADVKQALSDLFAGNLDGKELAENLLAALGRLKETIGIRLQAIRQTIKNFFKDLFTRETKYDDFGDVIAVEPIDVSKMLFKGFDAAITAVRNFTTTIKDFFYELWYSIVGGSLWTGIFDKDHEHDGAAAIGNTAGWGKGLSTAKLFIDKWSKAIYGIFTTLHTSATESWKSLVAFINSSSIDSVDVPFTNISVDFDVAIEAMKKSWDGFKKYLTTKTVLTPSGPEEVDTQFQTGLNKISEEWEEISGGMSDRWDTFYSHLTTKQIDTPAGLQTVENSFGESLRRMKEAYTSFSTSLPSLPALEDIGLTKQVGTPGGPPGTTTTEDTPMFAAAKESLKTTQELLANQPLVIGVRLIAFKIYDNLGDMRDTIINFFDDNKNIMGAAIASGIAFALKLKFNEKFRAGVFRGGIIAAVLAAAGSLGNEPEFVLAAKKIAQGLGEAIRSLLEGGSGDFIGDIGKGLINLAKELGKSFIDGFFPETISSFDPFGDEIEIKNPNLNFDAFGNQIRSGLLDNLGGVFVGLAAALLISPKLVLFMGSLALGMSRGIGTAMLGSKAVGFLADGISVGMIRSGAQAKKSKNFKTNFENTGILAGKAMRVGMMVANAATVGLMAQQFADMVIPDDALGGFGESLDVAIGAAAAGFAIGGPVGAAIGGAVGLAFDIYNNPELRSKIAEMGVAVKDFFVNGWESAKNTIAEGFEAMFDGLFPSWLKGLFADRNQEKFDGLVDEVGTNETGPAVDDLLAAYRNASQGIRDDLDHETQARIKHLAEVNNDTTALNRLGVSVGTAATLSDQMGQSFSETHKALQDGLLYAGVHGENFTKRDLHGNYATGGAVNGPGTGTSDDIPAMLSNGEFVMQQSAVQKFGPGFMAKINAGIMPIGRSSGGLAGQIEQVIEAREVALGRGDNVGRIEASRLEAQLRKLVNASEAQLAILEDADASDEDKEEVIGDLSDAAARADLAQSFAEGFKNDFKASLSNLLKTGDFKEFFSGVLDSFTGRVIDSFVEGLVDSMFKGLTGEGGWLTKLFAGTNAFGDGIGEKTASGISKSLKSQEGEGGVMSGISGFFGSMFESIKGIFSGEGEGGGLLSSLGGILSGIGGGIMKIFGFSQGGIVPSTSTSQAGKDSVPAMLMPGEVVLSKNDVSRMGNNSGGGSTQSFNISVQGDVSRQTRREIVKMIPQITSGVNITNKEKSR